MIFNMQLSEDASLAELSDIRVGVDGTVYPSAGDAVRGQITDVKEDFNKRFVIGRNKFNGTFENYRIDGTGHFIPIESGYDASKYAAERTFCKVDSSTAYIMHAEVVPKIITSVWLHEYSAASESSWIKATNIGALQSANTILAFTTSATTQYIRICFNTSTASVTDWESMIPTDLMIEQGSTSDRTEYEPFGILDLDYVDDGDLIQKINSLEYFLTDSDIADVNKFIETGEIDYSEYVSGVRGTNETISPNAARLTTKKVFNLKAGDVVKVTNIDTGLKAVVGGGRNNVAIFDSGWKTADYTYEVPSDKEGTYWVVIAFLNGTTAISPSDVSTLTVTVIPNTLLSKSVDSIENQISLIENGYERYNAEFESGAISTATGLPYASQYYLRTINYEKTSDALSVSAPVKYYINVFYYTYSGGTYTFDHRVERSPEGNSSDIYIDTNYPYWKISVGIWASYGETISFDDLKNVIIKKRGVYSEVYNGIENGAMLPDYWLSYMDSKKADIDDAVSGFGNHGDCFQFFTDYHYEDNRKLSPALLKYVYNRGVLKVFFGGDAFNNETYSDAIAVLGNFRQDMKGLPFYSVIGNHDNNPYNQQADIFNDNEEYTFLFADVEANQNAEWGNGFNYYIDNKKQKIRYIFVGNYSVDNTDATWIASVLNGITDNDYKVVVIIHSVFNLASQNPITINKTTQGVYIEGLCDAYNTRGSFTYNSGTWSFSTAKGKMACVICGHIHMDYTEQAAGGYPIIATTCDCNKITQQTPTTVVRESGTYEEQAYDIFCIDTTAKTIKTIRIGYGSDRDFTFD